MLPEMEISVIAGTVNIKCSSSALHSQIITWTCTCYMFLVVRDSPQPGLSATWPDWRHGCPRRRTRPSVLLCSGKTVGLQWGSPNSQQSCRETEKKSSSFLYRSSSPTCVRAKSVPPTLHRGVLQVAAWTALWGGFFLQQWAKCSAGSQHMRSFVV